MKASSYEEQIIEILKKEKIKFQREKTFSDLKKGRYRFDFEIYLDGGPVLVEVQGQQHYEFVPKFHKSRMDFYAAQERDRKKINYCLAHNIPLYIIPYWELDSIHCVADILVPKFFTTSMWKNDVAWQNHRNLTCRPFH